MRHCISFSDEETENVKTFLNKEFTFNKVNVKENNEKGRKKKKIVLH